MKNLIIIGARGFGREVFHYTKECRGYNETWTIKGFLDDKSDALLGYEHCPPILDSVEHYSPLDNDVFICALGDVKFKKKYATHILEKGGQFINLIHNSANVGANTVLGKGCIVLPNAVISCDCKIGDFVTFQTMVAIGHDSKISDFCHLNAFAFLGGWVEIEQEVTVHTKACILPRLKIGKNSIVGAGSIVIKSVKPATTVFGNPAKQIA
jgi:sugar O-acyltransferase (sialic acid O-acetyltransferase NeuD family)